MMLRRRLIACLGMLTAALLPFPGNAQGDTGTVMGHVYCADTQKPARFANVRLQPVDTQGARFFGGRGGFATTGSDGSFRITGVSPGEYYAEVMMPGYVQPMRGLLRDMEELPAAERDRLTAQLTRVSVTANQAANVQITIYRGATIAGTVSFDDGAPAAGVPVQAYLLTGSSSAQSGAGASQASFAGFAQTDDRGQFRVPGLADGSYIVSANPRSIFPIYYGNTIERSTAKKLAVHAGDEISGMDIQIPAGGMHRVSGVVVAQQDGHALARALVQLRLRSGSAGAISATTAPDGSFVFNAVPDGKFTVQLSNAYDAATSMDYTSAGQTLEVDGTDISDLIVNAAPHN